jgi:hippurate hydrolase
MRVGPIMAAIDEFDITVQGRGGHAALPHRSIDPVVVQAQVVSALQGIVSRTLDPLASAVLSITRVHGGEAYNAIPDNVVLGGTVRTFTPAVRATMRASIERVATQVCAAFGARAAIDYRPLYPATINTAAETARAARAAARVVGEDNVDADAPPLMASEDFAYMLQARPGSYIFIGNGDGAGSCMLHNAGYDFNDEVLTLGAGYWAALVEQELATSSSPPVS